MSNRKKLTAEELERLREESEHFRERDEEADRQDFEEMEQLHCKEPEVAALRNAFLRGELSESENQRFLAHVQNCRKCEQALSAEAEVLAAFDEIGPEAVAKLLNEAIERKRSVAITTEREELSPEERERIRKVGERFQERGRRADAESREAVQEAWDMTKQADADENHDEQGQ